MLSPVCVFGNPAPTITWKWTPVDLAISLLLKFWPTFPNQVSEMFNVGEEAQRLGHTIRVQVARTSRIHAMMLITSASTLCRSTSRRTYSCTVETRRWTVRTYVVLPCGFQQPKRSSSCLQRPMLAPAVRMNHRQPCSVQLASATRGCRRREAGGEGSRSRRKIVSERMEASS